jgi:Tfp pilus assembly protein PilV
MHPKPSFIPLLHLKGANLETGFILLEVLVAMGLVLSAWTGSLHAYQGLAIRQQQLQTQKAHIRKQADAYELNMHQQNQNIGVKQDESSRVPCRADVGHDATHPLTYQYRRSMEKTHSVRKIASTDC